MEKISNFSVINLKNEPDLSFQKKDVVTISYRFKHDNSPRKDIYGNVLPPLTGDYSGYPEKVGLFHDDRIYVLNEESGDLVKLNNLKPYEMNAKIQYLPKDFDFRQMEKLTGMHTDGWTIFEDGEKDSSYPHKIDAYGYMYDIQKLLLDGNYKEYDNPDLTPEMKETLTNFYGHWTKADHKTHTANDGYNYNERVGEQYFTAQDLIKLGEVNTILVQKRREEQKQEYEKRKEEEAAEKAEWEKQETAEKKKTLVYDTFKDQPVKTLDDVFSRQ
jgi:hypothetical protein